jgi:hypothetical protein
LPSGAFATDTPLTCIDDFYLVKHHLSVFFFAIAKNKRLYSFYKFKLGTIFKRSDFYLGPILLSATNPRIVE